MFGAAAACDECCQASVRRPDCLNLYSTVCELLQGLLGCDALLVCGVGEAPGGVWEVSRVAGVDRCNFRCLPCAQQCAILMPQHVLTWLLYTPPVSSCLPRVLKGLQGGAVTASGFALLHLAWDGCGQTAGVGSQRPHTQTGPGPWVNLLGSFTDLHSESGVGISLQGSSAMLGPSPAYVRPS